HSYSITVFTRLHTQATSQRKQRPIIPSTRGSCPASGLRVQPPPPPASCVLLPWAPSESALGTASVPPPAGKGCVDGSVRPTSFEKGLSTLSVRSYAVTAK